MYRRVLFFLNFKTLLLLTRGQLPDGVLHVRWLLASQLINPYECWSLTVSNCGRGHMPIQASLPVFHSTDGNTGTSTYRYRKIVATQLRTNTAGLTDTQPVRACRERASTTVQKTMNGDPSVSCLWPFDLMTSSCQWHRLGKTARTARATIPVP